MKRVLRQRLIITLAATLVAAAFGLLAGYWAGREVALRLTARGLDHDAARAISEGDTYAHDVHNALDAMNASRYPFCSKEDMELLRNLHYISHFLKDIGRIRNNKIACSTTLGREHLPGTELPKPDNIGTDGVKAYPDLPFFRSPNVVVVTLRAGDSYVVLYPYFESFREPSAIHRKFTTVSEPQRDQTLPLAGVAAQPSWPQLTMDGDFRVGEILYSTRCSSLSINHICMTAYFSVSEALMANRCEMKVMLVLGGTGGGLFGFLVALLYRRNRNLENQLRRAIRGDKLRVAYQPIVSLASGEIVGAEALARWTDEDSSAVGPDVFIKIAEDHGFVGEITRLVVRHVLRDFGETLRAYPDFRISINIAAEDLGDSHFLPMLEQSLDQAGVAASSVVIEITESSTALHQVAVEAIRHLRRLGHHVHIDDFGTGYSSLSYLHDLSVDAIKIDQSFTRAIGTQAVTVSILPQILAMAETLHLQVIVEGIETSQQARFFAGRAKSILGQGWLFGRPVPVEELLHRLRTEDAKAALVATAAA
jgi:sensor c-di-GMP phosphodiesterase-like protein